LIMSCRFAEHYGVLLNAVPAHWAGDDLEVWSMSDFAAIKMGTFSKELQELVKKCGEHIVKCEVSCKHLMVEIMQLC
jgi:Putative zinc-RING and/or ribbon